MISEGAGAFKASGWLSATFGTFYLTSRRLLYFRAALPLLTPWDLLPKKWEVGIHEIDRVAFGSLFDRIMFGGRRVLSIYTERGKRVTIMVSRPDDWKDEIEELIAAAGD